MADEFDDWTREATPHRVPVDVCFDRQLISDFEDVTRRFREQSAGMLEPPEDVKEELEAIAAKVKEKTRHLVFQSIGGRAWRKLLAEHPPTEEQQAESEEELAFNPETFPLAAMHASCVEPKITVKQAQWMADELPLRVFDRIWKACLEVNLFGGDEKKVAATVAVVASEKR